MQMITHALYGCASKASLIQLHIPLNVAASIVLQKRSCSCKRRVPCAELLCVPGVPKSLGLAARSAFSVVVYALACEVSMEEAAEQHVGPLRMPLQRSRSRQRKRRPR